MILGLDIGGANTKAASADGYIAKSVYLPLWRDEPLESVLHSLANMNPKAVGAVITGELADCYQSKADGISRIRAAAKEAFECPVHFWGVNGFDWRNPMELAAANWSASAALVSRDYESCLLVDMGSTTTDLIPIRERALAAPTDYLRLLAGELVYTGMLRTSIGSVLHAAIIEGHCVPLSPEFFAITADAYLVTGWISADQYSCDSPDGSDKNRSSALKRLARTVCADLDEIGEGGALAIAEQAVDLQLNAIIRAIERQSKRHELDVVVAAGIGERIIGRACELLDLSCICLSEDYGKRISEVFPAYAVARLLESRLHIGSP